MSLDTVREKKTSIWVYVVIGFLLLGMIGFGTQQFGQGSNAADKVLELGDNSINQNEIDQTKASLRINNPDLPEEMLTNNAIGILSARLALTDYMQKYPLTASAEIIRSNIVSDNAFFSSDGMFDATTYEKVVKNPEAYEQNLAKQLAVTDFQNRIINSAIVSDAEIMPMKALQNLVRNIEFVVVPKPELDDEINDEELATYFAENKDNYKSPEKWNVRYLELDREKLKASLLVSAEEIETAYNNYAKTAKANETRNVSYLLFPEDKQALAEQTAKQLQDTEKTYEEIQQSLKDDLADDSDLRDIKRTDALISGFADQIFDLSTVGSFSDAIKTDDGIFVFRLDNVNLDFKEKQDMSEDELKNLALEGKLNTEFNRLSQQIEEQGFASGETLDSLAESTGLEITETGLSAFNDLGKSLVNQEVNEILMDETILKNGSQIIPLETTDGRVLVISITDHQQSELQELTAVLEQVKADLMATNQLKAQQQTADDLIVKLRDSDANKMADVITDREIIRVDSLSPTTENEKLDILAKQYILSAPALLGLKNATTAGNLGGDILVYVIDSAEIKPADDENNQQYTDMLAQAMASAEMEGFLKSITERAKIIRLK